MDVVMKIFVAAIATAAGALLRSGGDSVLSDAGKKMFKNLKIK